MKVPYDKSKDKIEAYNLAKKVINKKYLSKWNIDIDVNCDGEKHTISANGKGFDMEIKFLHDHCKAELKLSFLLRAFQGKIEGIIKEELEKNL